MKNMKIAFLGIVSMLLMAFIIFIPMNAKAATITNGQSIKLVRQGKAFYKFTLDDDSLVQFAWSKNDKSLANVTIYADKNKEKKLYYIDNMNYGASGKEFIALSRGTYYVDMYDGNGSVAPKTIVKINWTLAKKYDKKNYSAKTAQKLEANTIVRIPQVHKYSYLRWYKITLPKAQNFTITMSYGRSHMILLLDSKMNYEEINDKFKYNSDYTKKYISEKLPKGTYYILVTGVPEDSKVGEAIAFKWN